MRNKKLLNIFIIILIGIISFSCSKGNGSNDKETENIQEDSWCVGKWTGTTQRNEEYVVRIYDDGTADVKFHGSNVRESYGASFKAEWEPFDDDIIKLADPDGHQIVGSKDVTYDYKWSMYLSKEGNFTSNFDRLYSNPYAHLNKK